MKILAFWRVLDRARAFTTGMTGRASDVPYGMFGLPFDSEAFGCYLSLIVPSIDVTGISGSRHTVEVSDLLELHISNTVLMRQ